jgi:hypothetical protein
MAQIVYILTNPVMPGVVKIGKTDKEDVTKRAKELFTTGVPVPFDCVYACEVSGNTEVEKALHTRFTRYRINPHREFFWLTARTAVKALKGYEIADATPDVRFDADGKLSGDEKNARWQARQKAIKEYPGYARGADMHLKLNAKNGK